MTYTLLKAMLKPQINKLKLGYLLCECLVLFNEFLPHISEFQLISLLCGGEGWGWGGVDILFLLCPVSAIRFPVISRKSIYPIFTKFGMSVYCVNSLHAIAFGEDSCRVIAT